MIAAPLFLAAQIVLWHAYSGGEEKALETLVQKWNLSAGHIPVELVAVPFASMADKLQAAIPRGHGPDVFFFAHDIVGEWSRYGLLTPLEGELSFSDVLPTLLPRTVAPLRVHGKLWGLPLSFKSLALFYRTDLLPAPPTTTEEMRAICRRFRETSPPSAPRFGLVYEAGDFFRHAVWVHGFGGAIWPAGSPAPRFDTPQELRALQFVADMARRHDIPDEMTAVLVTQFFNQGRAAMTLNGPWFIGQIEPGVPYGVAPLPRMSETGRMAAPLTNIEAGFLNPKSQVRAEAAAFLRYLVAPEAALLRARLGRQSVSTAATWDDAQVRKDPVLSAFRAQLESMVPMDNRPEMRAFWEPGQQALRQVLRGSVEPERALRLAQQQLDIFLRPMPRRAPEGPYMAMLSLLLLCGALWTYQRLRRRALFAEMWKRRGAYGYLGPAAISMLLLVFVPFAVGAGMSLFTLDMNGNWRFVGAANFRSILLCRDTPCWQPLSFYYTLLVTVLWTVLNVMLHVLIGGTLALLLRDPFMRLKGVYRMLLLVPWAVPNYITALIWKGMFNRQFGAINGILVWIGLSPVSWFSRFSTALCANVATNVWLGFPFMMVVCLGALSQIPPEVEEAAVLDGAGRWQTLRHVILPLLGPALLPSIMLGAVWTFNMFNIVFLVSGGEPDGATDILVSQAYRWAFTRGHRYGYAAAYAVLIFVVLIFQSAVMRRYSDRAGAVDE